MGLLVVGALAEPDLLFLPWQTPLEDWPEESTVALPKGISRHIVRFIRLHGVVYALKETEQPIAQREYDLLHTINELGIPSVEPIGIISGRTDSEGNELKSVLMTRHLEYSLPYRALFSSTLSAETATRLLDALALLLVQLHLNGFSWGDCSLSNTLFRRDAGAFAAYLVDAETGDVHKQLSDGQRSYDIDLAVTNVTGEFMDLSAAELLHESIDPYTTGEEVKTRYNRLWNLVTDPVMMKSSERFKLDERIQELNDLGFDVAEMISTTSTHPSDSELRIIMRPKVVDAGHHARRLIRLTGLDVEENQARRLLNDLDQFRLEHNISVEDEQISAHMWVTVAFERVMSLIPKQLRGKLEPAQIYHEFLQHRWYMSEKAGFDVGRDVAATNYAETVLKNRPNEKAIIGSPSTDDDSGVTTSALLFPEATIDMDVN
ncbi:MAG: DUF4032 domain-containing protein [Actinobacteria bacterium]|nr:DUF4032 domain-containing protein [Actinomycetota bacterium]